MNDFLLSSSSSSESHIQTGSSSSTASSLMSARHHKNHDVELKNNSSSGSSSSSREELAKSHDLDKIVVDCKSKMSYDEADSDNDSELSSDSSSKSAPNKASISNESVVENVVQSFENSTTTPSAIENADLIDNQIAQLKLDSTSKKSDKTAEAENQSDPSKTDETAIKTEKVDTNLDVIKQENYESSEDNGQEEIIDGFALLTFEKESDLMVINNSMLSIFFPMNLNFLFIFSFLFF